MHKLKNLFGSTWRLEHYCDNTGWQVSVILKQKPHLLPFMFAC